MNRLDLVNTLQGSASDYHFSRGNTYPAVGQPRGMTYWTPQSSDGPFIFDRRCPTMCGVRATHSPSPWMGDFGHFDLLPVVGDFGLTPDQRRTAFDHAASRFAPHRSATQLPQTQIALDLTATARCAVLTLTFPHDAAGRAGLVLQVGQGTQPTTSRVHVSDANGMIQGISRASCGGSSEGFGCWFVVQAVGKSAAQAYTFTPDQVAHQSTELTHARPGGYLRFHGSGPITLRIATSFIDLDHARSHLDREIGDRDHYLEVLGRVGAAAFMALYQHQPYLPGTADCAVRHTWGISPALDIAVIKKWVFGIESEAARRAGKRTAGEINASKLLAESDAMFGRLTDKQLMNLAKKHSVI